MSQDPPEFPARWAIAFGEDDCGQWQAFEVKGVRQIMRWIVPGTFMMGSPKGEVDRGDSETQHKVTLSKGYWLAETACTQNLWQAVMGENPSEFKGDHARPVETVSWDDCQGFITRLNSELDGGLTLRLPTEAEWEYACRAGTKTPFSFGEDIDTQQANYDGNYPYAGAEKGEFRETTVPVLDFSPNTWGLYQMHGNVYEWCNDWYAEFQSGSETDPKGPDAGQGRVLRGGGWIYDAQSLRSADRGDSAPVFRLHNFGFRLAGGLSSGAATSQ